MTAEIAPAVIEKEKMIAFARDYDPIPLHTGEKYAKTAPFGRLIAPGVILGRLGIGAWQIFGAHGAKKDYTVSCQ